MREHRTSTADSAAAASACQPIGWARLLPILFLLLLLPAAQALTRTYYINTSDCTTWTNPGCSTTDERGFNGAGMLTCKYNDTLPAGSSVSGPRRAEDGKFLIKMEK